MSGIGGWVLSFCLTQKTTALSDRDVVVGPLVPNCHVVDGPSGQSTDQPSEADEASDLDDGDSGALFDTDAEDHPIQLERILLSTTW